VTRAIKALGVHKAGLVVSWCLRPTLHRGEGPPALSCGSACDGIIEVLHVFFNSRTLARQLTQTTNSRAVHFDDRSNVLMLAVSMSCCAVLIQLYLQCLELLSVHVLAQCLKLLLQPLHQRFVIVLATHLFLPVLAHFWILAELRPVAGDKHH